MTTPLDARRLVDREAAFRPQTRSFDDSPIEPTSSVPRPCDMLAGAGV
jgi:hypothetical protein